MHLHRLSALAFALAALQAGPSLAQDLLPAPPYRVGYIGQQIVPTGTLFRGTTVGGLSGIDHDPTSGRFVAISDDRSGINPARFYGLTLDVGLFQRSATPGMGGVAFQSVTTILTPAGLPFATNTVDPEGIRRNAANGNLFWSNEGQRTDAGFQPPTVREMTAGGTHLRDFAVPSAYVPAGSSAGNQPGDRGIVNNLAFESLTVSPDGRTLWTATENALVQDGPQAAVGTGSPSRILAFDIATGAAKAEYVYRTEPVAIPPNPATAFATNGLTDLLALGDGTFIAVERSFATGAQTPGTPVTGNTIKLFHVDVRGATDVAGLPSFASLAGLVPAAKSLLLDLSTLRNDDGSALALDNIEGLAFGADRDGAKTLVLVSDNNFGGTQFTQFVALSVAPVPEPETWALLGCGLGWLGFVAQRRRAAGRGSRGGGARKDPATPLRRAVAGAFLATSSALAGAQSVGPATFVNGLAIPGAQPDLSAGTLVDRRLGFFSDIAYDPLRREWWGLSDRGPGGGTLDYATRVQRFTLDVAADGAISNFQVAQTILFAAGGASLNGMAPGTPGVLGNAFDPEGIAVHPITGNLLVSDEYGPSLAEFDRSGALVRRYAVPDNLVPRTAAGTDYNAAAASLVSGREGNRGFEGLTVSPDGRFAYAMLQNGTIQDGYSTASGNRGLYTSIVKFDTATGQAVGQYAYRLESSAQGRGISAIVALGNEKFLVLERNNRGIGVGATLAAADKNVFQIDLAGASDVSSISLPASGALPPGIVAATKGARVIDLDADTLAALGNRSPEKWEGLAIGPLLANGQSLLLAGSDNDYSVTQNGTGTQFDVWFRFADADPYASSIQCPIGGTGNCTFTANGGAAVLTTQYALLPGVLHAYTASIAGLVTPVPEPETIALLGAGLLLLAARARTRRPEGRAKGA